MPDRITIDPAAIENLRSLNPGDNDEFLREIVGIFLADTPKRLTELDECLSRQDSRGFTRAAHSIKGSSANVGATQLRASAEQLEHYSNTQGLSGVDPMVTDVRVCFTAAQAELKRVAGL